MNAPSRVVLRRRGLSRRLRRRARCTSRSSRRSSSGCSASSASSSSRRGARSRMVEALFWPALLAYGEAAFAYCVRAHVTRGDVGRAARLARADRAARRPGRARRRLPVVELGGLAQPLRLARRRRVPDLGLPPALPAARPRGDAARRACSSSSRGSAAAREPARARTTATSSSSCTSASCSPRSRASRSPPALAALYLWEERRLKRRAADILRLAPAAARSARAARASDDRGLAAAADARARRSGSCGCARTAAPSTRSRR